MQFQNREQIWDRDGHVPSGWGNVAEPGPLKQLTHFFYEKLQSHGAEMPGRTKPKEKYRQGYEVPGTRPGQSGAPPERKGPRARRPKK